MGRWHADAVERVGGRVVAVIDPNEQALAALGRRHPRAVCARHLDAAEIARAAGVAHVCSPLATHEDVISRLLEAGVHVLAEKPLVDDADATMRLVSLAERKRLVLCPVHQFLFQEGVRQLQDWLPSLGATRRVAFSTASAGADGRSPRELHDFVAEILPHPLALAHRLFGTAVGDLAWHVAYPAAGELSASTTIGSTVFELSISAHGRPTENVLRVVADAGSVEVNLFHGFAVRRSPSVSRSAKITQPFRNAGLELVSASGNLARRAVRREPAYPGLRELVRLFYASVANGSEHPIPVSETIDVARARDAITARMRALTT